MRAGLGLPFLSLAACSNRDHPRPDSWDQGELRHLLPLVSHNGINIKLSFASPRATAPQLAIGARQVAGVPSDSDGRFWAFRVGGLAPNTEYRLQLREPGGAPLCDPWPLRTFPAPGEAADRLRVAAFTCAGGPDLPVFPGGRHAFKPVPYRQRLNDLILDYQPDLVIANGDHVYWDYRSWVDNRDSALGRMAVDLYLASYGRFDETLPVPGTANEQTLKTIADEQIARSYGVRFRSTPVFFITDDHDYFENDDATPERVTFPPGGFHQSLRNTLQALYFPEFIADAAVPAMPGLAEAGELRLATHFGRLQYGDLLSAVLYDCGGQLSLDGEQAGLVPAPVEQWLLQQTAEENTRHFMHCPSHPMGWTAGKWREWYPDILHSDGALVAEVPRDKQGGKYLWQPGWWQQHQRLLAALAAQQRRQPLMVSGDLHLLGAGRILGSGELDFGARPVTSILSGPVGIGDLGWLSRARGLSAQTPATLRREDIMAPVERNGFTLMDFTRAGCAVQLLGCPAGYVEPASLQLATLQQFALPA
ncbi:hypothetical protein [Parahaliea mediterranea]|uniref:hypothetical protein n=1 Tax=Parahaliea mediterranea TaxID=651086 RepID=UPI001300B2FD|nr:hypothetical protein [Parahaliea mediterranea]